MTLPGEPIVLRAFADEADLPYFGRQQRDAARRELEVNHCNVFTKTIEMHVVGKASEAFGKLANKASSATGQLFDSHVSTPRREMAEEGAFTFRGRFGVPAEKLRVFELRLTFVHAAIVSTVGREIDPSGTGSTPLLWRRS